jgi:glycosyltransferase involved in cell wall biosynthesis
MHSLRLKELPPPPNCKTGWPWNDASQTSPAECEDLPRITVVTPSYNQGQFIEETIRSVLLQGYPNLEYCVVDGGSTDNTLEIVRKYDKHLSWWVSESDRGQAHAINKGLSRATGSICGWINSDDLLRPGALIKVGTAHKGFPRDLIVGDVIDFWQDSKKQDLVRQDQIDLRSFVEFWNRRGSWHQPGIFFPTYLLKDVGMLDENLRFLFDYDFFCRALTLAGVQYLHVPVASFRLHIESKTVSEGDLFLFELCKISQRYWDKVPNVDRTGYRKHASGMLFCSGCHRLVRKEDQAWRFLAEGIKTHPFWALFAALKLLPSWPSRRWRETKSKPLQRETGPVQGF